MEFKTTLSKFSGKDASVYELHLPVPKPIAEQFIRGENRRIICEINQTTSIRSGLMPPQRLLVHTPQSGCHQEAWLGYWKYGDSQIIPR